MTGREGKSSPFLKKRTKKTFVYSAAATGTSMAADDRQAKVFWFFLSKKELLAFLRLPRMTWRA